MTDFSLLKNEFRKLIKTIGIQREEIEGIISGGPSLSEEEKKKKDKALDQLDKAMAELRKRMAETEITPEERKRRIAELEEEIEDIDIIIAFETDFDERMRLRRKRSVLHAKIGEYKSASVFHFEDLLDPEGQDFKSMLEEADKDIKARRNLQRVLKGIEIALRIGVFAAAQSAKLAVGVAIP